MNNGQDGAATFTIFILFVLIVVVYLTPTIIAYRREHAQRVAITWTNILLGWTFLGWVAAFVWSLTNPQVVSTQPSQSSHAYVDRSDSKTCPQCAETVKRGALVCRYCGWKF